MGDEQDFPKPIERCFNYVLGIIARKDCPTCNPNEEHQTCPDYKIMKISPTIYRGWNYFNKSCSCDCSENKQKK